MICAVEICQWEATYWYHRQGRRIGYCFGHSTIESRTAGRRERKERP